MRTAFSPRGLMNRARAQISQKLNLTHYHSIPFTSFLNLMPARCTARDALTAELSTTTICFLPLDSWAQ
jgi:hypothetical protein